MWTWLIIIVVIIVIKCCIEQSGTLMNLLLKLFIIGEFIPDV